MAGIQGVEEVKEKRSKGCRNPGSGEPRGSRNPRGQVLKSGRNSKGGALPAAREFRHSSPKLRLSEQTSSFSAQAESLPVRFPPHAGFLCFFGAFIAEFYIFYFYE